MTTRQETPLAIYRETTLCDHCQAEMTCYSDGILAYAVSPDQTMEVTLLSRDKSIVTAGCPKRWQVGGEDETCGGQFLWNLAEPQTWTADREAFEFFAYATPLDLA